MAEVNVNKRKMLVALEILESSDDTSEDDEIVPCIVNYLAMKEERPKIAKYVEDVVSNYSEFEFKKNFRVSKVTAKKLSQEFQMSEFYPRTLHGSEKVSAESHILSFLWFAGNKSSIRDVAGRFGVGESTLHRNCDRVMAFMLHIAPRIIFFPKTTEDKAKAANDFLEASGFPGVIGCIDGTYIAVRTPVHKIRSTYVNRHDMTSITVQGVCDSKKKFTDVFVGPPSKIHDSRILRLSFIFKELPSLCEYRWHLLGDAAYPLREWLLTPYRDYGHLTEAQKTYNKTHSACRVHIENAFGILKQRFRQLIRLDFWTVDKVSKFVMSCCVLHNLCIDGDDLWDDNCILEVENVVVPEDGRGEAQLRRAGEVKRERICFILQDMDH